MDDNQNQKSSDIGMGAGTASRTRAAQAQVGYGSVGGLLTPQEGYAPDKAYQERAYQDPLRVRVEKRLTRISHDAEALFRVQAILNEHPEFEQLIELQNLVNRHGL